MPPVTSFVFSSGEMLIVVMLGVLLLLAVKK